MLSWLLMSERGAIVSSFVCDGKAPFVCGSHGDVTVKGVQAQMYRRRGDDCVRQLPIHMSSTQVGATVRDGCSSSVSRRQHGTSDAEDNVNAKPTCRRKELGENHDDKQKETDHEGQDGCE